MAVKSVTLALVAAALALGTTDAVAGTAVTETRLQFNKFGSDEVSTLRFVADTGEANRLTIGLLDDRMVFSDSAAPIRTAGVGCRAGAGATVECDRPDTNPSSILLGDGSDQAVIDVAGLRSLGEANFGGKPALTVHGGAGADVLIGAKSSERVGTMLDGGADGDTVLGSDRDDVLIGGAGTDVVNAGADDDLIIDSIPTTRSDVPPFFLPTAVAVPDTPDRDVYNGGPGNDRVVYAGRVTAVRITIGQGGNEDRLAGIESAVGGSGNDRLVGDGGSNFLHGGPGADRLVGGAGRDGFDAGGDRSTDTIACGRGSDFVGGTGVQDFVGADCEHVNLDDDFEVGMVGGPRRRGRTVRVKLAYTLRPSGAEPNVPRPLPVRIYRGRRLLGTGSRPRPNRENRLGDWTSVIMLNRAGRKLAKPGATVVLRYGTVGFKTNVR